MRFSLDYENQENNLLLSSDKDSGFSRNREEYTGRSKLVILPRGAELLLTIQVIRSTGRKLGSIGQFLPILVVFAMLFFFGNSSCAVRCGFEKPSFWESAFSS